MPTGVNPEEQKQRAQYINMRGAQIAQEKAGQKTTLEPAPKSKGTKKQLIVTVAVIVAVFAALCLLGAFVL